MNQGQGEITRTMVNKPNPFIFTADVRKFWRLPGGRTRVEFRDGTRYTTQGRHVTQPKKGDVYVIYRIKAGAAEASMNPMSEGFLSRTAVNILKSGT